MLERLQHEGLNLSFVEHGDQHNEATMSRESSYDENQQLVLAHSDGSMGELH